MVFQRHEDRDDEREEAFEEREEALEDNEDERDEREYWMEVSEEEQIAEGNLTVSDTADGHDPLPSLDDEDSFENALDEEGMHEEDED